MGQKNQCRPEEDAVSIRLDITVDLPAEFASEVERLGIYRFDECVHDEDNRRMILSAATKFYRTKKGA